MTTRGLRTTTTMRPRVCKEVEPHVSDFRESIEYVCAVRENIYICNISNVGKLKVFHARYTCLGGGVPLAFGAAVKE